MSTHETINGNTPSERFVAGLCERSFLRLWTHPNPKGKKGKELCDCLIVCGPHIIIVSVKENEYQDTGDITGWKRWTKAAIGKSLLQIYGAERWLTTVDIVENLNGRIVSLPARSERQYHRIAVALGSNGEVPITWGDSGKGFVHVCDELGIHALFSTLDTITDFVEFLRATEALVNCGIRPLLDGGGIENLVALFILQGYSLNFDGMEHGAPDVLVVQNDLWSGFVGSDHFVELQEKYRESYLWDRIIDHFAKYLLAGEMFDMHSKGVTDNELALVTMAMQPRRVRALLAERLKEFHQDEELRSAARVVKGFMDVAFVFTHGSSIDREARMQELMLRCLVVRGRFPGIHTVVGIATEKPGTSSVGYSSDIAYIYMPEWTDSDESTVEAIQKELGYFKNINWGE